MLPHLDAAYNLARWLTGSAADAEDAVQDACVRALTFFDGFHGADGRAWLLAIVRNTCYDWLRKHRRATLLAAPEELERAPDPAPGPEAEQLRRADARMLQEGLDCAARRIPRGAGIARIGRHALSGDRASDGRAYWNRDVPPGARTQAPGRGVRLKEKSRGLH